MCQNQNVVGVMKTFSKNIFPAVHINPIHRDLILVVAIALTIAVVMATAGMMVFSQI